MPNHFLTVGLAARDWKRMEDDGVEDVDYKPLESVNLCEAVDPTPAAFDGIVAANPRYRSRNKTTGEFSKDVNGQYGDEWEKVNLTAEETASLVAEYGADCWYDWQTKNWGTKWGTYSLKVRESDADGSPVIIEFQTAWGPPNKATMRKIEAYLNEKYYLTDLLWIGHDPGSGQTLVIE